MKTGVVPAQNLQALIGEGWDAGVHIALAALGVPPTADNYHKVQSLLEVEGGIKKLEPLVKRRIRQLNNLKTRRGRLRKDLGVLDEEAR